MAAPRIAVHGRREAEQAPRGAVAKQVTQRTLIWSPGRTFSRLTPLLRIVRWFVASSAHVTTAPFSSFTSRYTIECGAISTSCFTVPCNTVHAEVS